MDRLRGRVNWSEEVRRFIEKRVERLEQEEAIEELEKLIEQLPPAPRGAGAALVRKDRGSH